MGIRQAGPAAAAALLAGVLTVAALTVLPVAWALTAGIVLAVSMAHRLAPAPRLARRRQPSA